MIIIRATVLISLMFLGLRADTNDSWKLADAGSILGFIPSEGLPPAIRIDVPPPEDNTPAGGKDFSLAYGSCREMQWFRIRAGLPQEFDHLGWRESRCVNNTRTFCCYGYWQNYIMSHLSKQSAYRERIINECGVTGVSDIFGISRAQKQQQACVTKVVYDISGFSPWK